MLILSRKESEKVVFPTLGITVELLRVRGNKARLGIDAPAEVPVLRAELSGLKAIDFTTEESDKTKLSRLTRSMRTRLERACTTLNLLHRRLEKQPDPKLEQLVLEIFQELNQLDKEAGGAVEDSQCRSGRALLVEDDANIRELLGSYLQLSGFDVMMAADGQDALNYLCLHAMPDVVLVDMVMPRCDGPTFVRNVRADEQFSGLRLYAVSGTDPQSLGVATGPNGIDRWFAKPVDPEQLVQVLASELGFAAAV
jgi:carbon storage regulator CsrA